MTLHERVHSESKLQDVYHASRRSMREFTLEACRLKYRATTMEFTLGRSIMVNHSLHEWHMNTYGQTAVLNLHGYTALWIHMGKLQFEDKQLVECTVVYWELNLHLVNFVTRVLFFAYGWSFWKFHLGHKWFSPSTACFACHYLKAWLSSSTCRFCAKT